MEGLGWSEALGQRMETSSCISAIPVINTIRNSAFSGHRITSFTVPA
jgi:hypothetical protein